ncbi:hypothetical protein WA556_001395 [Blastocystis sp. ATCC 50177/Nand II]
MGTVLNVLQNTPRKRLLEVIILDDKGEPPVTWNPDPERVRIVRSNERLGLIRARITGGNAARGDFIVFLDAHCRVSPRWLETPHRLLMENNKTIVNFVDFIMTEDFNVKPATAGIGSSATIYNSLRQFWGGGSSSDNYTPITMGMFAITKYWWQQGQMDPALNIWGGENVEISFRTWLCGGRIVVARDSYVAHYFRTKPTYSYDGRVVLQNYVRIAHTWMDEDSLIEFYNANEMHYEKGVIPDYVGDISARLELKKSLNCKPFPTYLKQFEGRTFCSKENKNCGLVYTVNPSDIKESVEEIFNMFCVCCM